MAFILLWGGGGNYKVHYCNEIGSVGERAISNWAETQRYNCWSSHWNRTGMRLGQVLMMSFVPKICFLLTCWMNLQSDKTLCINVFFFFYAWFWSLLRSWDFLHLALCFVSYVYTVHTASQLTKFSFSCVLRLYRPRFSAIWGKICHLNSTSCNTSKFDSRMLTNRQNNKDSGNYINRV